MTWHTARVRMWNMRTPMQKLGFPLFIYVYIYIINHIGKTFHNISSPTIFYNSYLTRIPLTAVYNTWLVPVTACDNATVDSLWHWNETGQALDWCQLYYWGQYLFCKLTNIFSVSEKYSFQMKYSKWCKSNKHFIVDCVFCLWEAGFQ